MIARDSKLYPYLAIAQHYGVSYREVLKFIEDNSADAENDWQLAALDSLTEEIYRLNRKGNESELDYNRRMNEEDKIWNAAIEAAAKCVEIMPVLADKIRKLKK